MAELKGAPLALPLTWEEHELSTGYSSVVYDANGAAIDMHLSSRQAEAIARMVNSHGEMLRLVKRLRETAEYLARMRRKQGDDEGARLNDLFIALEIDPAIAAAEGREG